MGKYVCISTGSQGCRLHVVTSLDDMCLSQTVIGMSLQSMLQVKPAELTSHQLQPNLVAAVQTARKRSLLRAHALILRKVKQQHARCLLMYQHRSAHIDTVSAQACRRSAGRARACRFAVACMLDVTVRRLKSSIKCFDVLFEYFGQPQRRYCLRDVPRLRLGGPSHSLRSASLCT